MVEGDGGWLTGGGWGERGRGGKINKKNVKNSRKGKWETVKNVLGRMIFEEKTLRREEEKLRRMGQGAEGTEDKTRRKRSNKEEKACVTGLTRRMGRAGG